MPLTKVTNLGRIIINPSVISKEILNSATVVNEKLFFATEKGKVIGAPKKVGLGELSANVKLNQLDGKILVTMYIVMNFGASIKAATDTILNNLEKSINSMFPDQNVIVTIKIVGVKSKNIAPRDIEVSREYESSR